MRIEEFKEKFTITDKHIMSNFELEGEKNIDVNINDGCLNCGDKHNQEQWRSEAWTSVQTCNICERVNLVYYSDRMSGARTDLVMTYRERE